MDSLCAVSHYQIGLFTPLSYKVACWEFLCSLHDLWMSVDIGYEPASYTAWYCKKSLLFPLLKMECTLSSSGSVLTMSANCQRVNIECCGFFKTKPWKSWLTPSQLFKVQTLSQCPPLLCIRLSYRQDQNSSLRNGQVWGKSP